MTEAEFLVALGKALQRVGEQLSTPPKAEAERPTAEPKYMRVRDFARSRGYAESTIRSWVRAGMPAVPTARGHRILPGAADAWIQAGGVLRAIDRMAKVQ